MRCCGIAFVLACVGCSKQPLTAPTAHDAGGALDATPAVPTTLAPESVRVVHCTSSDGKYRVDLALHGSESQPRTAHVLDPSHADNTGVALGGGFPPPGELTCSKSDDPSYVGCFVANTADYGYIVNVRLQPGGKRSLELRKNGVASSHLASLDCEE